MISKFSVKKPYTVLVGVVLSIVLGIVSFTKTTTDLLPSISLPYVIVMTTYPGASPETVEMVVTKPVEASMATVSNIEGMTSVSSENYSMVILEFAQSADMNAVSLEIRENLDQVKSYWDDTVGNPIIMKLNPDMLPVMMVAVGVDDMSYGEISDYVKNTVMPEIESLEGVASASAVGLLEESVNVIIRQEKVDALNQKIYAAIDDKMKEAEDELADGKKKLEDGEKELEDGKKELVSGQKKLDDGKKELEKGKEELNKTQEDTAKQLAETKNQLLTAKTNLEAAKLSLSTNLTTARGLQAGIDQVKAIAGGNVDVLTQYQEQMRIIIDNTPAEDLIPMPSDVPLPTALPLPSDFPLPTALPWPTQAPAETPVPAETPAPADPSDPVQASVSKEAPAAEGSTALQEAVNVQTEGHSEEGTVSETTETTALQETEYTEETGRLTETAVSAGEATADTAEDAPVLSYGEEADATAYRAPMTQEQQANVAAATAQIQKIKSDFMESEIVKQGAASSEDMANMIRQLSDLDWADPANSVTVGGTLGLLTTAVNLQLAGQINNLQQSLNAITNGMGLAAYEKLVADTTKTLDENLEKVNEGLVEVEKGELKAAIEFANATTKISLGEMQMEQGQAQLDAAKEQVKTGEEQMKDALEQLEDGEQKLADAKEEAYDKANMIEILSVDTIKALLTAQNFSMPAGYVTEDGVDYMVRIGDKPDTIELLECMPLMDLHMDGVPTVTLQDVADVFYTDNSADIYTNVNGNPGCILSIQKQTGYSTGEVSDRLLDRFKKMMTEDQKLSVITLMDQGVYIDLVMDSIFSNIIWGGLLAVLILLLFLRDLRPTLIVAFSIPISLVTAIVCMYFSGVTLNVISLSGLALGIGMLVDNSIVVIENIYRLRGEGASVKEAAVKGASEVTGAIIASTLTTVCVFAPIVFTEGITRQLFVDMGLTIAYSLLASLVIALTVVPAMASKLLTNNKAQQEGKIFNVFTRGYGKVLELSLKVKPLVLILVLCMLVISFALAWSNGIAFMSDMDSTQMTVSVKMPDDAQLFETAEVTDQVVEILMQMEDIQDVGAMASTSSMGLLTGAGNSSSTSTSIYVVTKEEKSMSNEELAAEIMRKTEDLPAEITVDTSSMDMSALGGSGITVQIHGRDIDTLQRIAGEVAAIVESVEGTCDVSDGMQESKDELRITVVKEKAMNYGLTVAQVFQQIYPKLAAASSATSLAAPEKDYSIYVSREMDESLTRELLKELPIKGTDQDGKEVKVPLSEIADFSDAKSLNSINRVNQTRSISVSAGIADGYNVGKVASVLEKRMENYQVPEGYSLVFSGENETIMEAMSQMLLMLLLAVILMYLIMVAQFQSLLSPFIVMFTVPLAFTGGFLGLYLSGSEISVIAMIGFVMLAGIIVNNGIVLIDYMNQLREEGMPKREAILLAGKTRIRPVFMTALTTILALSTMAFSHDMGSEMGKPMAITTISGLIYGTLLTLIVVPCIYDLLMKDTSVKKKRKKRRNTQEEEYEETEGRTRITAEVSEPYAYDASQDRYEEERMAQAYEMEQEMETQAGMQEEPFADHGGDAENEPQSEPSAENGRDADPGESVENR